MNIAMPPTSGVGDGVDRALVGLDDPADAAREPADERREDEGGDGGDQRRSGGSEVVDGMSVGDSSDQL